MERTILHCDLNNFYANVECLIEPKLKNVPLAVCGDPQKRHGVILAKNDKAKSFDIRTGDVVWQAKQKCADLVIVPPHFDLYMKYSKQAFNLYCEYSSAVEPFGADECWLDCTGSLKLFKDGKTIADTIRERLKTQIGLTASVGVSFNKTFAKLGSDLKKPDATTIIDKNNFKQVIWILPVRELLMVGKSTEKTLLKLNIKTIGELANADEKILKAHLGINGIKLKQSALGMDEQAVREAVKAHDAISIGHGMTAIKDLTEFDQCCNMIYFLTQKVCTRLRKNNFRAGLISITLRDTSLQSITRQKALNISTFSFQIIAQAACALLKENWDNRPLRTITVSVSKLEDINTLRQSTMFDDIKIKKMEQLDMAVQNINQKYGENSLKLASLTGLDFIYDKTDEEDFLPFQR